MKTQRAFPEFESLHPYVKDLVCKALQTNRVRDAKEAEAGFQSVSNCSWDLQLRTALTALSVGMEHKDWDSIAEAFCIVQETERRMRQSME